MSESGPEEGKPMTPLVKDVVHLARLLEILGRVAEVERGLPAGKDNFRRDAEALGGKFIMHSWSIVALCRRTRFPQRKPKPINFFDAPSIIVLIRAAFECLLIYGAIYVLPETEDEQRARWLAWRIDSSRLQLRIDPIDVEVRRQQKSVQDKRSDNLKALASNGYYQALSPAAQNSLVNGGFKKDYGSTPMVWQAMGISSIHSQLMYAYLCDFSHSGAISITQIREGALGEGSLGGVMGVLKVAAANMVQFYAGKSDLRTKEYQRIPEDKQFVEEWVWIGTQEHPGFVAADPGGRPKSRGRAESNGGY